MAGPTRLTDLPKVPMTVVDSPDEVDADNLQNKAASSSPATFGFKASLIPPAPSSMRMQDPNPDNNAWVKNHEDKSVPKNIDYLENVGTDEAAKSMVKADDALETLRRDNSTRHPVNKRWTRPPSR